jgi:hypothetical protein
MRAAPVLTQPASHPMVDIVADAVPAATSWSHKEIDRFMGRVVLFTRRGVKPAEAEQWAERLVARDREKDTRRLCIECEHLQRDGGCFALSRNPGGYRQGDRLFPVTTVLQRCHRFEWQKP